MAVDLHTVGDSSSLSYPFLPPSHDLNHSNNINTKESPLSPHLHTSQSTNAQAQGKDKDDDDDDLVAELTRQMHMAHFMLQDDHKFDFSGIGSQNMESVLVCLLILPLCEKPFSSFFFKNLYTTVPFYTFSFFFLVGSHFICFFCWSHGTQWVGPNQQLCGQLCAQIRGVLKGRPLRNHLHLRTAMILVGKLPTTWLGCSRRWNSTKGEVPIPNTTPIVGFQEARSWRLPLLESAHTNLSFSNKFELFK